MPSRAVARRFGASRIHYFGTYVTCCMAAANKKSIGSPGVSVHSVGTRDIGHGIAAWDAYVYVADPDALAAEFASREVRFFKPLRDNQDNLRGFEIEDADGYILYFGRPN